MLENLWRAADLREAQINAAWATHRLSLIDGPPAWREAHRNMIQPHIDRLRVKIAAIKAEQHASPSSFGENPDEIPNFLRPAAAE